MSKEEEHQLFNHNKYYIKDIANLTKIIYKMCLAQGVDGT